MRSCWAISGFSSMLTLTIFTAPWASLTAFSSCGPSVLHGPHHGAQKSTITGTSRLGFRTTAAKVSSDLSLTWGTDAPLPAEASPGGLGEAMGRPPGPINAMLGTRVFLRPEHGVEGGERKDPVPGALIITLRPAGGMPQPGAASGRVSILGVWPQDSMNLSRSFLLTAIVRSLRSG